jgi:hypothetical protein
MKNLNDFAAKYLERLRQRFPEAWLDGFSELGGRGDRMMTAVAAVFGRMRERFKAELEAQRIARATGGVKATGQIRVVITNTSITGGATIAAGQVFAQTPAGVRFVLLDPFVIPAATAGSFTLDVEAEFAGVHANVPIPIVSEWAFDPANKDSITWSAGGDTAKNAFIAGIAAGTVYIDDTLAGNMTGGLPGSLDVIAAGRGLPRAEGEPDPILRRRLVRPQDAITPAGIRRAVAEALGVDESLVEVSEVWVHGFAWGVSGWGVSPWSAMLWVYILIPSGSDVVAIQALVDRIKPIGIIAKVMEIAP